MLGGVIQLQKQEVKTVLPEELTLLHGRGGQGIMPILKAQLTWYLLQRPSLASLHRGKCFLLHVSSALYSLGHGWGYLLRCPPAPTDWAFPRIFLYLPLSPSFNPNSWCWQRVDTTKHCSHGPITECGVDTFAIILVLVEVSPKARTWVQVVYL